MIKTVNDNQHDIIKDIISLHCPQGIECDPTYSKGNFYEKSLIAKPEFKFDAFPQTPDTIQSEASTLPLNDSSIKSLMFDPPFIVGHTKDKPTGIMGTRFHGFKYIADLWEWYDLCIKEFYRVLETNGVLIVKCQDTVSSGKQWFSHVHIINEAEKNGFYTKDLFILVA
ncbi:MAG: hypothetical protein WCL22_03800, partial [bacterium]